MAEKVEGLQTKLQHKADQNSLQEARQQLGSVRQQSQHSAQALADLKGSVRQQGLTAPAAPAAALCCVCRASNK